MSELKLLITIPPNAYQDAQEGFDFQDSVVKHIAKGLSLNELGEGKWDSKVGITMEVVE